MHWKILPSTLRIIIGIGLIMMTALGVYSDIIQATETTARLFGLSILAWVFIVFVIAAIFTIYKLRSHIHSIEKSASDPYLKKAQDKHLKHIEELIINWTNCLEIQPIQLVAKGMPIPTDELKKAPLFRCLKEHLPYRKYRNLWDNFSEWDIEVDEYLKTCKKLRSQIQESWKIEGTEPTEYFTEPILKLIDGDKKELRYRIDIIIDHTLEEVRYQKLVIDGTEVVRGLETLKGGLFKQPLKDEQWDKQILTLEYKRIAEEFKDNATTIKAKELFKHLSKLQDKLKGILQETLERGDYIKKSCRQCPIK